ncbi:MAG: S41 family peptidase [Bacteroidetes bacterium]|jgi:carboxyl-terminal processing protease|nr:S41 family peptidase [Bacteroidota bacterium]HQW45646.1 S41 family peptidase [Chitinophagaceae bacterium]MBK6820294.1 S41 family peptidase [Bacteroidota bacterium]MBK7041194.1 S41 family peptidase [Bacteroidota bacterium]MBK8328732.1 S41 family peptidase [Bacteroidota bacterium]
MKSVYQHTKKYLAGIALGITIMLFVNAKDTDSYFEISKNLEVFTTLFKELSTYYVDPIQPGKLVKTGIDAMLEELDPYTNYITEEDIEDYRFQTTGKYGGIGSTVRIKDDYLAISEPYENSPITKAGMKAGDLILEIDGRSTKGKEIEDLSKFLKGAPGTQIKLKVKDAFTGAESVKTITREEINVSSVPYAGMVGDQNEYAYVRLTQFTERCGSILRSALDSLKKANPNTKGVILDLRYNPGGLLDEAVNICGLFINGNQLVVSTKGKSAEWDKDYKTLGSPWDEKIPLTVLTNRNSASASEIVAGTMQDLDRGVVIGQRSFGKGLVQTTRSLSFNAKLKVTTAKYYTPSGRCIQALDYSHRNEDGSVGEIPDSIKTKFKTKNGRTVMDGGGIDPDIKTTSKEALRIISTLVTKSFSFDYATEYVKTHPSIAPPKDFKISENDFNDFVKWLDGKDYSYKTKTEESLVAFKEIAVKENYFDGVKKDFEMLQKTLNHDKKQDLIKNKKEIMQLLQAEIVTRYYFQKGRLQNQLKEDDEVLEAIHILADQSKYESLLRGK